MPNKSTAEQIEAVADVVAALHPLALIAVVSLKAAIAALKGLGKDTKSLEEELVVAEAALARFKGAIGKFDALFPAQPGGGPTTVGG